MKNTKIYTAAVLLLLAITAASNAQPETKSAEAKAAKTPVPNSSVQTDAEKRKKIEIELLKAKAILETDGGKLWGEKIWDEHLLVIDFDNTIYSLSNFPGSVSDTSSGLFYKKIPANTLSPVNTTQKYEGREYATVLINYLDDQSATIIHELFHLLQFKKRTFNGNPVDYLDETEARKLLRLEFQGLRNTLEAIEAKKSRKQIAGYFKDALLFRKVRQGKYREFLANELEIETLEGLANYTGFVLSSRPDKYRLAIEEINRREKAPTYTRPFPYATGPAYGLIFDFLGVSWKKGLNNVYNFLEIYEMRVSKGKLKINDSIIEKARKRNNYGEIERQENEKAERRKALIDYYTKMFVKSATLKVELADDRYSRSFNMNGTLVLKEKGTIYSSIKGTDRSGGKNFGNFATIEGKNVLGVAGVLGYEKNGRLFFEFPSPRRIEGNKITGDFYEITLNDDWKVVTEADGNMSIVKKD